MHTSRYRRISECLIFWCHLRAISQIFENLDSLWSTRYAIYMIVHRINLFLKSYCVIIVYLRRIIVFFIFSTFFYLLIFYLCAGYLKRSLILWSRGMSIDPVRHVIIYLFYTNIFFYIMIVVTIICSRFREKGKRDRKKVNSCLTININFFEQYCDFLYKLLSHVNIYYFYNKSWILSHQSNWRNKKNYMNWIWNCKCNL